MVQLSTKRIFGACGHLTSKEIMMHYITLLLAVFLVSLLIYTLYQETKHEIWNKLVSRYGCLKKDLRSDDIRVQMVFFRMEDEVEFSYFNSMNVGYGEHGIEIAPTLNHLFLKPIFIPRSDIENIGKKRLFLLERTIYKVKGLDVFLGILDDKK